MLGHRLYRLAKSLYDAGRRNPKQSESVNFCERERAFSLEDVEDSGAGREKLLVLTRARRGGFHHTAGCNWRSKVQICIAIVD